MPSVLDENDRPASNDAVVTFLSFGAFDKIFDEYRGQKRLVLPPLVLSLFAMVASPKGS